jgi:hypothetical protein
VLLVLAVVWGVVLVSWLRSRAQATFGDPVGTFRRHLTVLEHTAPSIVPAANRLRPTARAASPGGIPPYRASGVVAGRSSSPVPSRRPERPAARPGPGAARPAPVASNSAAAQRRRMAKKRRRDVFFALIAAALGSLVLGLIPGLRVMLYVQVLCDLLLAAYVMLLVRMRNLAAERELKLAYLPRQASAPRASAPRASAPRQVATARQASAARSAPRRRSEDPTGEIDLTAYEQAEYGQVAYAGGGYALRRVAAN